MSQQGMVIDSLEFARQRRMLSGRLELGALPRLGEMLFDAAGALDFSVAGETAGGESFLALSVDGTLRLVCQRCLGGLEHPVRIRSRLMLVAPGAPWPEDGQEGALEDDSCDAIEAARELDLLPLLEEDILLALPIAPRHARCEPPRFSGGDDEASPFAKLAALKRGG
ncbi:MAG: DUF177 domain-containing protein [Rhodocyclales bacterium]|nr:DUF177 domain-containing protein [Rhodocyclales bacterium]